MQGRPIRIGVLTDLSGPYCDTGGPTSGVASARQAVEDFGPGHRLAVVLTGAGEQAFRPLSKSDCPLIRK